MSIIHEALKKVQQKTPQDSVTTDPGPTPHKSSPAVFRLFPALALAGILAGLLLPSWLYRVRPALPARIQACPQLRLEGILETGGKKIALINGNIYEEGQTAENCTITTIHTQKVTISDGKKEFNLTVSAGK